MSRNYRNRLEADIRDKERRSNSLDENIDAKEKKINQLAAKADDDKEMYWGDSAAIQPLKLTLEVGERKQLHFSTSKGEAHLSIRAVRTQLNMKPVRILILNDIRNELDDKELDSWIKLTRVLTHEMMNSIAPISSISETFMQREDVVNTPLYDGIRAIRETSAGLVNFVDSYRKFSSLQQPSPKPFYLGDLLQQIVGLNIIPAHIVFTMQITPKNLMLYADPNLIRQMFINLIKNAVQAIGDKAGCIISRRTRLRMTISIFL